MNRLKLVFLGLIVVLLAVLFVQNREPLALKLLCPDITQTCLYRTPALPLAVWMGIFTLGGMMSNLVGQAFNRYRYSGSKSPTNRDEWTREKNQWSSEGYTRARENRERSKDRSQYDTNNYELPQKPEKVETSGTTYSYKYRDIKDESNGKKTTTNPNDIRDSSTSDSEINLDKDDDEDWI